MPKSRQLSAIMFTDIVGYTALMGDDEDKAFEILEKSRQLQKPLIKHYNGQWIKEMGDGVMASFPNVSDAILCANDIQCAAEHVSGLKLRIGIHLGEVIFENNDIFGDGVNLASRIQAIAPIGGIYISEAAQEMISNKKNIETKFVNETVLKNVKEPLKIYEVILKSCDTIASGKDLKEDEFDHFKSIAVLPFNNLSNDPKQEYFGDGIAEEILNSLAHIKDIKVVGRSSSFQFKGKGVDVEEVGRKLNVRTVLEGSVRRQANKLRITVQLIDAHDGFHIWAERYDRNIDDIFAIQDEIAASVTEKLKITLLGDEKRLSPKVPTENKEAYDLYLKGRFYLSKRGPGLLKGLEIFNQSIKLDPEFGLAYAGLADSYGLIALYSVLPAPIAAPKAKEAAERAIAIDSSRVEPYSALAFLSLIYDYDWKAASTNFEKAFAINSSYAPTHYWFSNYLNWVEKDYSRAIQEAQKAIDLEPLFSHCYNVLSSAHLCNGTFNEAKNASLTAVELDPNSFLSYSSLGMCLKEEKKIDEALEAFNTGVKVSGRHQYSLFELCWLYASMNNTDEAKKILDELKDRSSSEFISGLSLCVAAYCCNKFDESVKYLELAYKQRAGLLPSIKGYPVFSFINNDKRFKRILEKMNFPK